MLIKGLLREIINREKFQEIIRMRKHNINYTEVVLTSDRKI